MINSFKIFLETYHEKNSTFSHDGNEYDLNGIFDFIETTPTIKLPISDLDWVLKYTKIYKKRIDKVILKHPIIVTKWKNKWVVIDGVHRLTRLKRKGIENVDVKIFPYLYLDLFKLPT